MLKMPFRSIALPAAALLGMGAILGGCDSETTADSQPQEQAADENEPAGELTGTLERENAGDAIPDFSFVNPARENLNLKGLEGTPVLINLWATWCAPCVLEMPMLDELAGEYDGKLRVLTISQDLKGAEQVEPFFAERQFSHIEPWLDPDNKLAFHYGGGAVLPTTILYDAEGKEVWRMVGGFDWTSDEAKALIAEVLPTGEEETAG